MDLSIIIPVLYQKEILSLTLIHLKALIAQSDMSIEIIVVDSCKYGSTVKRLKDPNIKKRISFPGFMTSCRAGSEIARGRLLLFLPPNCYLPITAFQSIKELVSQPNFSHGAFHIKPKTKKEIPNCLLWFYHVLINKTGLISRYHGWLIKSSIFYKFNGKNKQNPSSIFKLLLSLKKEGLVTIFLNQSITFTPELKLRFNINKRFNFINNIFKKIKSLKQ